ncbi:MAG: DoxX family protein [Propionicimonas sp.]|uniref:DoxX family protein n=1 Tax=Propionicimonas sp. TaxID=1955623 RepID=UPI002B2103F5|nr:DoxX family protein [Propionicimonas sp.]MEA4943344.1 DoxX family protein [Propionicimonas sp.]MEA5054507.1 DoxX family protein [Propionicimonas sp.]MEA5119439.1 DoxX family protein [Propionicimonas sp.]
MEVVLWIVTILAAAVFGCTGIAKLSRSSSELSARGFTIAENFSPAAVKAIGVAEVAGALGLLLPALTGIARFLVPTAAFGLAALMVGAMVVHIRRNEYSSLALNLALLAVALFVGIGRLGVAPI